MQTQHALEAVEARLEAEPGDIETQFERACLLAAMGEIERAKQCYLEILHQDPTHFGTLNNFGTLLYETDFRSAARTVYTQAVTHYPEKPLAHVNLANLLVYEGEMAEAQSHYETALRLEPGNMQAHEGLSALFLESGEEEKMQHHRKMAFWSQPVRTFPYRGNAQPVPILVLISAQGGDLPWRKIIDDRVFLPISLAAEFCSAAMPLPPHRLIFNAIGDADSCASSLEAAQTLLTKTTAPVINPPRAVLATGRAGNAERLRGIQGVVTPRIAMLPRASLAAEELHFPLLLRSPGFHTGKHFIRVEHKNALAAAAATLPGEKLLAIEYLDARGADGYSRKYRVMMIDGQLYPLHLAVSEHWKVHYFSAAMADNPAHRAEESAFLNDMPGTLGEKAMAALRAVQAKLGLDYGGIDFGVNAAGDLLLFEANATMLISPPGKDKVWDYRRAAIGRALEAARNMLSARAGL